MHLEQTFKNHANIKEIYENYLYSDYNITILLLTADFVKIVNGAKPQSLFNHSCVELLLHGLKLGDEEFLMKIS